MCEEKIANLEKYLRKQEEICEISVAKIQVLRYCYESVYGMMDTDIERIIRNYQVLQT